jgi:hypothetical protein
VTKPPTCPECGSNDIADTLIQTYYNTGARWLCLSCGLPLNADGSPNKVLVRQPVGQASEGE